MKFLIILIFLLGLSGLCLAGGGCYDGPDESYIKCENECQEICFGSMENCSISCGDGIGTYDCQCNSGFIRHSTEKRVCISVDSCPAKCDANEVREDCASACQTNCDQRTVEMCIEVCVDDGCVCKSGYIRRSADDPTCIEESTCPAECGVNEVREDCASACQTNCDQRTVEMCIQVCVDDGCVCKPGYIRRSADDPTCIEESTCPAKCGTNEMHSDCASTCQPNCDQLFFEECTKDCILNTCICKPGYVRRSADVPTCIEESTCPVKCGQNEIFHKCPSNCQPNCFHRTIGKCNIACSRNQCICKSGYIRTSPTDATCVLEDSCPAQCGSNEAYVECMSADVCHRTCDNLGDRYLICPLICNPPGCQCKAGYVWKSLTDKTCILMSECPPKCGVNEKLSDCASTCQPDCQKREYFRCNKMCHRNSCVCKSGFIRRSKTDTECIEEDSCPEVRCKAPLVPYGGTSGASYDGMVEDGKFVAVHCDDGYIRKGPIRMRCVKGSFKVSKTTKCVKKFEDEDTDSDSD